MSSELLSAYVDGTLEVREREEVTAHLASCSACYDLFSEVVRVQDEMQIARPAAGGAPAVRPVPVPRPEASARGRGAFGRRRAVWGVATVLATAAAAVLVVRLQPAWWTGGVDPRLADLVEAVGEERTVEARLTGGFTYGPLRSPTRSGGRVGPSDNWSLLAAAGKIREIADTDATPENRHAAGVALVLTGAVDEAVAALEAVSVARAQDGRVWSDLSAAYLARAVSFNRPDDLPRALAAADRALVVDDGLVEGTFNRALALEALQRRDAAIAAWTTYLERDPSSAWSAEAKRHLAALASEP